MLAMEWGAGKGVKRVQGALRAKEEAKNRPALPESDTLDGLPKKTKNRGIEYAKSYRAARSKTRREIEGERFARRTYAEKREDERLRPAPPKKTAVKKPASPARHKPDFEKLKRTVKDQEGREIPQQEI